jgi:hypothetical protein
MEGEVFILAGACRPLSAILRVYSVRPRVIGCRTVSGLLRGRS